VAAAVGIGIVEDAVCDCVRGLYVYAFLTKFCICIDESRMDDNSIRTASEMAITPTTHDDEDGEDDEHMPKLASG